MVHFLAHTGTTGGLTGHSAHLKNYEDTFSSNTHDIGVPNSTSQVFRPSLHEAKHRLRLLPAMSAVYLQTSSNKGLCKATESGCLCCEAALKPGVSCGRLTSIQLRICHATYLPAPVRNTMCISNHQEQPNA